MEETINTYEITQTRVVTVRGYTSHEGYDRGFRALHRTMIDDDKEFVVGEIVETEVTIKKVDNADE